MKYFLNIFFLLVFCEAYTQNNASFSSADGKVFKVLEKGKSFNTVPQAHVLIEKIMKDTLRVELEFENKKKFPVTLYFLEQGVSCRNKEFNYKVEFDDVNLKLTFIGVYDIVPLPALLVPKKPIVDTSQKYKNKLFGHFFEMKDGKPVYFNNKPKQGNCVNPMPKEYLDYTALLISKAEVAEHKYVIVENVCRNNCYTVEQLSALLKYIDFEIEKLKLVRTAYKGLTDPANKKDLEKSFRLESAKNELNDFLKTADQSKITSNTLCTKSASQLLVDNYVQKLGTYSNDAERYEVFKKGYSDLCYSVDQVKQVLAKFIHDREKLDAARLLYFYCVEKDTYSKVVDVFSYNQTASELNDFIEKQR